jgi:hypothetical protein
MTTELTRWSEATEVILDTRKITEQCGQCGTFAQKENRRSHFAVGLAIAASCFVKYQYYTVKAQHRLQLILTGTSTRDAEGSVSLAHKQPHDRAPQYLDHVLTSSHFGVSSGKSRTNYSTRVVGNLLDIYSTTEKVNWFFDHMLS